MKLLPTRVCNKRHPVSFEGAPDRRAPRCKNQDVQRVRVCTASRKVASAPHFITHKLGAMPVQSSEPLRQGRGVRLVTDKEPCSETPDPLSWWCSCIPIAYAPRRDIRMPPSVGPKYMLCGIEDRLRVQAGGASIAR